MIVGIREGNKKGTALYIPQEKTIYIYDLIIPEGFVKEMKVSKETTLRYHTSYKKIIKVRKDPDEKRLEKELKKFLKAQK